MTQEELDKVLERHLHWLREDCDGWENMRAVLDGENLNGLNLNGALLDGASLVEASLDYASLVGASLNGASLVGASLNGVTNFPFIPFACPDTGSFICWKKAHGKIIKLEIPADAKRCSATSNKCRCDKAKVLEIQEIDGSVSDVTEIASNYDKNFIYKVGKTISVKDFCDDRWKECSQGIHFFINRQSAVEY